MTWDQPLISTDIRANVGRGFTHPHGCPWDWDPTRKEITLEAFLDDQSGGSLFLAPLANSLQVLGGEDLALLVTRGSRQASIGENGPFGQGLYFLFASFVPVSSPFTPLNRTMCFSSPWGKRR